MTLTVTKKVEFGRSAHAATNDPAGAPCNKAVTRRTPRISRLVALAIHMDRLVCDGVVADFADLARLAHVSRARITQIMNLRLLAPDIQEALLFSPATNHRRDRIGEREIRSITRLPAWNDQRRAFARLQSSG